MKHRSTLHFATLIPFLATGVHAEVTLDGTLGKSGALPGPDYQIGADVGQQHGGNLFHSFQDFNLQSHESATFSGPDNVQNVISRVTGGNPSSIDGTLRSTIPNADMYFLNPYGIMFGPNAKLDVQGGFHASTADYLRLQDGGRFEARTPSNSLLTVAPVAAFGFLTDTPAPITTQDSQLAVPKGNTFSLMGGGLEFQGNTPPDYDIYNEILTSHGSSWLLAESGRLNLASVASRGEVIPTAAGLDLTATTTGGPIRATNTELGVSDEEGGGKIFIRGGRFEMTRSLVNGQTVNQAGGVTDIQVANLTLNDQTVIETNTFGTAPGGHLNLQVSGELNQTSSSILANSHGTMPEAGNAGNIKVQARQVNLAEGAQIASSTFGSGQGGTVHLEVAETLTTTGGNAEGSRSGVFASSANEELTNAGNAGDVLIQARQVNLSGKAYIESSTFGSGQGGTVHLEVAETLTATGETAEGYSSGVLATSYNEELATAGNAGDVLIQARQVNLSDGAYIESSTFGSGQGGTVHLEVAETLTATGEDAEGYPSGVLATSYNEELATAGNAGGVTLRARNVNLTEGAVISSGTSGTGQGGTIHLEVAETLTATGPKTDGSGRAGGVHVSSKNKELANAGNAGDIVIQARQINLSGGAQIMGSTFGIGRGGTVSLEVAETLTATGENAITGAPSAVFATSINNQLANAGPAGNVIIQARQINLASGAQIGTGTFGAGQGNTLHLQVADTLSVTGQGSGVFVASDNEELANAGNAGQLILQARQVNLADGARISGITWGTGQGGNLFLQVEDTLTIDGQTHKSAVTARSRSSAENAGAAGLLNIQANTINILNGGEISTQSENAGGGDITVLSPNLLYLQQGQITTSVKGGIGNGGNITINTPVFVILASAKIIAQADEGKGGNITIRANQFIATPPPDSLVSASSKLGIDGQVVISSPDPNISGKLFLVSTKALDVSSQLKRPCGGAKSLEEIMNPRFKFYVYPIAGSRQSFEDWGPSPLPSRSARAVANGKTETVHGKPPKAGVDRSGYQPVMLVVECPKEERVGK